VHGIVKFGLPHHAAHPNAAVPAKRQPEIQRQIHVVGLLIGHRTNQTVFKGDRRRIGQRGLTGEQRARLVIDQQIHTAARELDTVGKLQRTVFYRDACQIAAYKSFQLFLRTLHCHPAAHTEQKGHHDTHQRHHQRRNPQRQFFSYR